MMPFFPAFNYPFFMSVLLQFMIAKTVESLRFIVLATFTRLLNPLWESVDIELATHLTWLRHYRSDYSTLL
jgi:hypothetical protein